MKRLLVALLTMAAPAIAPAQQRTLFGDNAYYGGYGGPVLRVTEIAGEGAAFFGGRGTLLINSTWGLGFSGIGWTDSNIRGNDGGLYELNLGYGGVTLEYIARTFDVLHVAAELTTAAGGAKQSPPGAARHHPDDTFLVVEPALTFEINLTRSMRIAAGGTYRYVSGIDLPAFTDDDVRGASFIVMVKFGSFDRKPRR